MAYSDYGGYAYRNGTRVEERSDFTITPEGGFGTPGSYPGFALMAAGATAGQVKEAANYPHAHAVLGDGPIYVTLYKQGLGGIYRGIERLSLIELVGDQPWIEKSEWQGKPYTYLDGDHFRKTGATATLEFDGYKLEVRFTDEDNYYVYARLTQPDGTIWTGFSGYGVGAGLEDSDLHGDHSTPEREAMLREVFD